MSDPQTVAQDGVRTPSWAVLKAQHVNTRTTERIPMAADLVAEVERLEVELQRARDADPWSNEPDQAPAIAERIRDLEARIQASEVVFVFEGMQRIAYRKLLVEHPPTAEQVKLAEENGMELAWNTETFPPAFMAASCIEPAELAGDVTEWTEIHDTWSHGVTSKLFRACNIANFGVAETPKSVAASVVLQSSGSS